MVANAPVQTPIDVDVKKRATAVLGNISPIVDAAAHDAWFRAKVQEALDDPRPAVPYEKAEAHFVERRATAQLKAGQGKT